jgi:hypothetical protein
LTGPGLQTIESYIRSALATSIIGIDHYPYLRSHDGFMTSLDGHPLFERLLREIRSRWEAFRA